MRVLVQWSYATPTDWEVYDSADWASIPKKAAVQGGGPLDGNRGWITALCVQGVVFTGDQYAVEDHGDGSCTVWLSNDRFGTQAAYTRAVRFYPLAQDSNFGGAYNTRQVQTIYSNDVATFPTAVPISSLPTQSETIKRYGVLMPDAAFRAHEDQQSKRSWREWLDGLPAAMVENGRLKSQRKLGLYLVPKGTRTYYMSTTPLANGIHTGDHELAMTLAPAGLGVLTSAPITTNGQVAFVGVSPTNEPNSAAWPSGNYRAQIDCITANSDVTYGALTLGSQGLGHFARVNAAITTELQTFPQQEAVFSLTGLRLATTGTVAWTAGTATDRFEVSISADRPTGMGTSTMSLELGEADDFADGPWAAAVTANAPFFGMNA